MICSLLLSYTLILNAWLIFATKRKLISSPLKDTSLTTWNIELYFIWSLGHARIIANELADKAAKETLALLGCGKAFLTASE